ncbi:MAG: methyl-accepting chemotaxis protein [Limnospira sp.]
MLKQLWTLLSWKGGSLRQRILRGYFVPLILFLIVAFLVYFMGVQPVRYQIQNVDKIYHEIEEVDNLAFSIVAMQRAAREYILGRDPITLNEYEEWDTLFYEKSEQLRSLIQQAEQRESLDRIITIGDRVNEFDRRLISYVELGKPEKVSEVLRRSESQAITRQLEELVNNFEQIKREQLTEQQERQIRLLEWLTILVFGSTAICGFAVLTLGFGISNTIDRETAQIATSSSEIAAALEEQERNLSLQASSVNQTTTTVDELNGTVRNSTEQAKAATAEARRALSLAEKGSEAVQQTLDRMELLRQKVVAIADRSRQLSEKSLQINRMAHIVSNLAYQTNLLALNASVEAVRAGEQGRGFGVVAVEIRKLADRSKQSAAEINTLVVDIQKAIQITVSATKEGKETVVESVGSAENMSAAFAGVSEAFHQVYINNQTISKTSEQQLIALQQVGDSMNDLNQAARQNAESIALLRSNTQRLNESLLKLR